MFGMEYFFNQANGAGVRQSAASTAAKSSRPTCSPARRGRTTRAAPIFERISPARSVFDGGPGAWELVLRFSYGDLDDRAIHGGKFWRITPMVNWHMSDNVRLEFVYGYGTLDRFDLRRHDAVLPDALSVPAVVQHGAYLSTR